MDLIKYDMTDIWAVAGDVVSPDSAKIRAGWGVEVVPRQWWNWFENRQDQNIAYMLQKGFPEWDATTEYIINKSYVQRNGTVYKATATSTNSDPVLLTNWVKAFSDYSIASTALGSLTPGANQLPYFTGTNSASTTTLSPFARTILDDTDASSVRDTISAQQASVNLTSLSGVTAVTNGLPYFTGTTAMGITTLTAFGRSFISSTDAVAARLVLGVDSSTDVNAALAAGLATRQPLNATLTTLATLTPSTNKLPYFTGTSTVATTDITVFSRTLLDDADATAARATLEVDSSATVASNLTSGLATRQPLSASLSALSFTTFAADQLPYFTSSSATALTTLTSFSRGVLASTTAAAFRSAIGADVADNLTSGTLPLARLPVQLAGKNAETATRLATARTIQGVSFDGTANISLPVVPQDSATGAASIPSGATGTRPGTPTNGMLRYNSDISTFEGYQGGAWATVGGAGIGSGQTWTNMTASRALSTTYTNSTGKPIMIAVYGSLGAGAFAPISVSVNGGTAFVFGAGDSPSGQTHGASTVIIPVGATYNVTASLTLNSWWELR